MRRSKLAKGGVNTRNDNVIISRVRVPEGVPHFNEQSFMVISFSGCNFNIFQT